jgi:hypothetical protein
VAVTAVVAGQVTFTGDDLTDLDTGDTGTQSGNFTHIFVTDGHRSLDVLLRPGIPVVNVYISTADGGFMNFDENFAGAGSRHGNFTQLQTGTGYGFNNGIHPFFHGITSKKISFCSFYHIFFVLSSGLWVS